MELILKRRYFPEGTNGDVFLEGTLLCHTIELPWKNNQRNISCIPEGRYLLLPRYTEERGWHFEVSGVQDRSFILFHAANNALSELKGCIAPVSSLTGEGKGLASKVALLKLESEVRQASEVEGAYLVIKKYDDGCD